MCKHAEKGNGLQYLLWPLCASGQYTLVKNPAIFCQGVTDLRLLNAFWGHLDKKTRISLSR